MNRSDSGSTVDSVSQKSITRLRVRYGETDAMGWVYYGNYYLYFETARSDLIRKVWKSYRQMEDEGYKMPVTESYCRYHRGARYDDEIEIHCSVSLPSPLRMRFDYTVKDCQSGTTLAVGHTQHCFVGDNGKPIRIPDDLYNTLSLA